MADLKLIASLNINENKIEYNNETLTQDCIEIVEFLNDSDDVIKSAIMNDIGFDNIKYLISRNKNNDWNNILRWAAYKGNKQVIDLIVENNEDGRYLYEIDINVHEIKKIDWNVGMYVSAEGGHRELVDLFIEKGADDWNVGLYKAASGGHRELVEFFYEKLDFPHQIEFGMAGAVKGGHKDLVTFFKNKGASDFEYCMITAIRNNRKELIDSFINNSGLEDWETYAAFAAESGNKDLVDFFIEKGASDWDSILYSAIISGNDDLIRYCHDKGGKIGIGHERIAELCGIKIDSLNSLVVQ